MYNHQDWRQTWYFTVSRQWPQFKIAVDARCHSHRHLVVAWHTARTKDYTTHCGLMKQIDTCVEDEAEHINIPQIYYHNHHYKPEPNCNFKKSPTKTHNNNNYFFKHNLIFLPWRFDLYQRSSSEEVCFHLLLPVLATVVMWCGKKMVVCMAPWKKKM